MFTKLIGAATLFAAGSLAAGGSPFVGATAVEPFSGEAALGQVGSCGAQDAKAPKEDAKAPKEDAKAPKEDAKAPAKAKDDKAKDGSCGKGSCGSKDMKEDMKKDKKDGSCGKDKKDGSSGADQK
jgi:uncharacterized low-complexity protein